MYDLIIIGAGPAGLSAAIYASRARLSAVVIEQNFVNGGQIIDTYEIDNYPGLPGISGMDLAAKMAEHAEKLGVETVYGFVQNLDLTGPVKKVETDEGTYEGGEEWLDNPDVVPFEDEDYGGYLYEGDDGGFVYNGDDGNWDAY